MNKIEAAKKELIRQREAEAHFKTYPETYKIVKVAGDTLEWLLDVVEEAQELIRRVCPQHHTHIRVGCGMCGKAMTSRTLLAKINEDE